MNASWMRHLRRFGRPKIFWLAAPGAASPRHHAGDHGEELSVEQCAIMSYMEEAETFLWVLNNHLELLEGLSWHGHNFIIIWQHAVKLTGAPAVEGITFTLCKVCHLMAPDRAAKRPNAFLSRFCVCKQTVPPIYLLYNVLSVPAGIVVWIGDDDELRVGDDGRPLLLPHFLGKRKRHKHSVWCFMIEGHDSGKHRGTGWEYICSMLRGRITRSHCGVAIFSCSFKCQTKVPPADINYLHLWGTTEISCPVALCA